mgnify:CR=1 FL=1
MDAEFNDLKYNGILERLNNLETRISLLEKGEISNSVTESGSNYEEKISDHIPE